MTTIQIRKAAREDAADAWRIRREAILHQCTSHYPRADLEAWTSDDLSEEFSRIVAEHFHVAVLDEQIVGTGLVDLRTGKMDAIFVSPSFMGTGIGRAMMLHLEGLALSAGLKRLHLDATLNAAPFYRSLGFQGDAVSIYQSPKGISLPCIPMVKAL